MHADYHKTLYSHFLNCYEVKAKTKRFQDWGSGTSSGVRLCQTLEHLHCNRQSLQVFKSFGFHHGNDSCAKCLLVLPEGLKWEGLKSGFLASSASWQSFPQCSKQFTFDFFVIALERPFYRQASVGVPLGKVLGPFSSCQLESESRFAAILTPSQTLQEETCYTSLCCC